MNLGIDFDAQNDDVFHSHGFAKAAYGSNLGSTSPAPAGGRAGTGGSVGAVGAYHYADVSHRHKRESILSRSSSEGDDSTRRTLRVNERDGKNNGAAFSHRDLSIPPVRVYREPPGRSYNPYS